MQSKTQTPQQTSPLDSRPDGRTCRLVVVLPALNESATVGAVVAGVPREIPGVTSVEVLVVDDGSTDATGATARQAGATVLRHPVRLGVGSAFQTGVSAALEHGADVIVSMDSDGQFNPADIPALIAPVLAGQADFASASRFIDPSLTPAMPRTKRWGNRVVARLVSRLSGQRFCDVSCGMRCFSRRAALNLNLMGEFTYTQEVFLNLAFKRMRIVEVPLRVLGERPHGRSRVASNLFVYGWNTMKIMLRCYRDYRPMRFFGRAAMAMFLPGLALLGFLGVHYLRTQMFSPHKWAGFTGAGLLLAGLLLLYMGMIGDMLNRHRVYLEELLYRQRIGQTPLPPPGEPPAAATPPGRAEN
ncbi:MAG: Undecaprenyl-phosphate 4-deoxy-4-formamido-L-arabinose transferase [Phycisphaerae bacterium]|nr:Undecaprenyl-phosphate 4-deoxy-4-formamido-L-arabinose transferase [Phycisphaerae bacterium]